MFQLFLFVNRQFSFSKALNQCVALLFSFDSSVIISNKCKTARQYIDIMQAAGSQQAFCMQVVGRQQADTGKQALAQVSSIQTSSFQADRQQARNRQATDKHQAGSRQAAGKQQAGRQVRGRQKTDR